ncbi:MAG: hypothetical protein JXA37_10850 [Chloroflexia bacterium]|nr:hypothetical protein [Chloroflexia bacterium]
MATDLTCQFLDAEGDAWAAEVDHVRALLGAPHNPQLFPPQYLKATFPRIGGRIAFLRAGPRLLGVAFLFPRDLESGRPVYTLRWHSLEPSFQPDPQQLSGLLAPKLAAERLVFYDPSARQRYVRTTADRVGDEIEIGRPGPDEAAAIRQLQQRIWQSEDDLLYPADVHSVGFGGLSLVARAAGQVVGFAFALPRFGAAPLPPDWQQRFPSRLRLESQLLGVLPAYRQRAIAFLLKRAQAQEALRRGLGLIHWTVDPLQFGNAVLNFAKLRALAFSFSPDHYPYRNALNRVAASRLEITWLVGAAPVQRALQRSVGRGLPELPPDLPRANPGGLDWKPALDAPCLAIELPENWNELQQADLSLAQRWRETTDQLLAHYLGLRPGQYAISGVAAEGPRRYLVAERLGPAFWADWLADPTGEVG